MQEDGDLMDGGDLYVKILSLQVLNILSIIILIFCRKSML